MGVGTEELAGQVDGRAFLRFDAVLKDCYERISRSRVPVARRLRLQQRLARITERGVTDLPSALEESERFARELDRALSSWAPS